MLSRRHNPKPWALHVPHLLWRVKSGATASPCWFSAGHGVTQKLHSADGQTPVCLITPDQLGCIKLNLVAFVCVLLLRGGLGGKTRPRCSQQQHQFVPPVPYTKPLLYRKNASCSSSFSLAVPQPCVAKIEAAATDRMHARRPSLALDLTPNEHGCNPRQSVRSFFSSSSSFLLHKWDQSEWDWTRPMQRKGRCFMRQRDELGGGAPPDNTNGNATRKGQVAATHTVHTALDSKSRNSKG